jgi:hypothetical protein
MKNLNGSNGNRTRDLQARSAVPQPNAPPRTPTQLRNDMMMIPPPYTTRLVCSLPIHPVVAVMTFVIHSHPSFHGYGTARLLNAPQPGVHDYDCVWTCVTSHARFLCNPTGSGLGRECDVTPSYDEAAPKNIKRYTVGNSTSMKDASSYSKDRRSVNFTPPLPAVTRQVFMPHDGQSSIQTPEVPIAIHTANVFICPCESNSTAFKLCIFETFLRQDWKAKRTNAVLAAVQDHVSPCFTYCRPKYIVSFLFLARKSS